MGIGGQYAAINSAIDEMMPSKYRGRVDIWINGSYWAGGDPRFVRLARVPERLRPERRLAPRVPDGTGSRDRRDGKSLEDITKPITATEQAPRAVPELA
jgi:hypothetical protein